MLFFWSVLCIVLLQRISELLLAAKNARWIRASGGYEVGSSHYKYIVVLHITFFVSLILEVMYRRELHSLPSWWMVPFTFFVLAQLMRYWCIASLGRHWNTRILILPGAEPLRLGPYRFLRHPNYWVVAIELLSLPLTFHAFTTAIVFTLLNAWILLRIRIPLETQAVYQRQRSK